jgi:DnaJ-class molecular chaperone
VDTCKPCDGRGRVRRKTDDGFIESPNLCSACGGSGRKPMPGKGKRRFFRKRMEDEENPSLEAQTQAFLRKHGR